MEMQDLIKKVDHDEGLTTVTMGELRKIQGSRRLGKNVNEAISRELASAGLGHLPAELPLRKEQPVRLYRVGGRIDRIVAAVTHPSLVGDSELRNIEAGLNGTDILDRLRRQFLSQEVKS